MKKITTLLGLLAVGFTNAQESEYYGRVGINTETPQATLDIVGRPTDPNAVDGLLIPRLTLGELYNKNPEIYGDKQISTLIYIYNVGDHLPMHRRYRHIQREGFYYWSGEQWMPFYQIINVNAIEFEVPKSEKEKDKN